MPHTIAVAGKGGVGKTTTCGMLIDYLCKKRRGPVLVVDADANSNLNEVLGVEVETSLGHLFPDLAEAGVNLHAQNFVQIGIGIGIDHQNGAVALLAQVIDQHAAGGGFTHTALTGNSDGMRHSFCSFARVYRNGHTTPISIQRYRITDGR